MPNPGIALIRDGNGTRSFETLLRYRGAALAEFWRALKTLKALQAEQAAVPVEPAAGVLALDARGSSTTAGVPSAHRPRPNEPGPRSTPCETTVWGTTERQPPRTLHEPPARWTPNEPDPGRDSARTPRRGGGPRSPRPAADQTNPGPAESW
jgi:hypothetical protein